MDGFPRKAGLVLGATLLATGWGMLQFADTRQKAIAEGSSDAISLWAGERTKVSTWLSEDKHMSGKMLALLGIVGMGSGAAIAALVLTAGRRFDAG